MTSNNDCCATYKSQLNSLFALALVLTALQFVAFIYITKLINSTDEKRTTLEKELTRQQVRLDSTCAVLEQLLKAYIDQPARPRKSD